jgi:phage head maturation protease
MTMIKRAKTFALKSGALEQNQISGIASVAGVLDSYNDVILPGAFTPSTLTEFLSAGFVAANHDWREVVAMPLVAEVRGNDLYTEAEFHSTDDAQSLRVKCAERLEKGLAVGLSIGFTMAPGDYRSFANGAALLKWAEGAGYDLRAIDAAGISAHEKRCQAITRIAKLYEYSVVSAPANPETWATEVKAEVAISHDGAAIRGIDRGPELFVPAPADTAPFTEDPSDSPSSVLPAGTMEEHAEAALAVAKAFADRLAGLHALRAKEGRPLSETNRERAAQLRAALADCVERLSQIADDSAPLPEIDMAPMRLAYLRVRQRHLRAIAEEASAA